MSKEGDQIMNKDKPETKPKTYIEMMEQRLEIIEKVQKQDIATIEQLKLNIQSRHGAIIELKNSIKAYRDYIKITEPIKAIPGKDKEKQKNKVT